MEITANKLAKWLKDSVKWLISQQMGCTTLKLDDRLAVCVGWLPGFGDEKRDDVIQGEGGDADYAIVAGIKVWTSDDMRTDYDFIAFPYHEDGENEAFEDTISPKEDYAKLAETILKDYDSIKGLDIEESGEIKESTSLGESTVSEEDEIFDKVCFGTLLSNGDRDALFDTKEEAIAYAKKHKNVDSIVRVAFYITDDGEDIFNDDDETVWTREDGEIEVDSDNEFLAGINGVDSFEGGESCHKSLHEGEDESTRIRSAVYNHFSEGYLEDKFFDLIVDLIERVDGNYLDEDAIYEAMDAGMVYNDDQWTMIMHYCTPSDANFNEAWDAMYMDILSICEDLAGEAEDED